MAKHSGAVTGQKSIPGYTLRARQNMTKTVNIKKEEVHTLQQLKDVNKHNMRLSDALKNIEQNTAHSQENKTIVALTDNQWLEK